MDREYHRAYDDKRKKENESLIYSDEECRMNTLYTKEDDEFIKSSFQAMTMLEIGYALGRTEDSIKKRIHLLRKKGYIEKYKIKRRK